MTANDTTGATWRKATDRNAQGSWVAACRAACER
jgi:hypothetical protein